MAATGRAAEHHGRRREARDHLDLEIDPAQCQALNHAEDGTSLRPEPENRKPDLLAFGMQPNPTETIMLSSDTLFVERLRDILWPHLNPPEKALLPPVHETTHIRPLDRSQPQPPTRPSNMQPRSAFSPFPKCPTFQYPSFTILQRSLAPVLSQPGIAGTKQG